MRKWYEDEDGYLSIEKFSPWTVNSGHEDMTDEEREQYCEDIKDEMFSEDLQRLIEEGLTEEELEDIYDNFIII